MFWAALLPDSQLCDSQRIEAVRGLATWCLQFTPRVAVVDSASDSPAVVMELEASVRLFGGKRALVQRVREESAELSIGQLSWAPTSLAAVALARAGLSNGYAKPLEGVLDALPVDVLLPIAAHSAVLARLGCQQLGHVRALPRGGMSRRFDKELLGALDQAYGLRPEVHTWITLPETFHAKLELMSRVEHAPAILFGARRLLLQMCAWLTARQSGVTAYTLRWCHDAMRSKTVGDGGEITIRTAAPSRSVEHLSRLLAEHLAKVQLQAPVGDLELLADDVAKQPEKTLSLLPDTQHDGESLGLVLERIAARLGPQRVLRPVVHEDHRPEWMCHWQPAPAPRPRKLARQLDCPQPTFLLPQPLRLAVRESRPMYQGVLLLLAGPHRIEFGWWDRIVDAANDLLVQPAPGEPSQRPVPPPADGTAAPPVPITTANRNVTRDYWVALSEHAGLLWIFQTRLADDKGAWFLHGVFA